MYLDGLGSGVRGGLLEGRLDHLHEPVAEHDVDTAIVLLQPHLVTLVGDLFPAELGTGADTSRYHPFFPALISLIAIDVPGEALRAPVHHMQLLGASGEALRLGLHAFGWWPCGVISWFNDNARQPGRNHDQAAEIRAREMAVPLAKHE